MAAASARYPRCTGGHGAAPGEDAGGAWELMAREQQRVWALVRTACIMATLLDGGPGALLSDYPGEMEELREHYPLLRDWPEPFRRRAVNRALAELAESERRDP